VRKKQRRKRNRQRFYVRTVCRKAVIHAELYVLHPGGFEDKTQSI